MATIFGTNSLDPSSALGVTDEFLLGAFVTVGGLLAGITAGLFAGRRGWGLAVPSGVGLAVGVAVFLILNALWPSTSFDSDIPIWVIWAAQSVAILTSVWLSGLKLAASILAAVLLGVGLNYVVQGLPAEVYLVIGEYSVIEATGECSGAGQLAIVAEGSFVSIGKDGEGTRLVTLNRGSEVTDSSDPDSLLPIARRVVGDLKTGCAFFLGDPAPSVSDYLQTELCVEQPGRPCLDLDFVEGSSGQERSGQQFVFVIGGRLERDTSGWAFLTWPPSCVLSTTVVPTARHVLTRDRTRWHALEAVILSKDTDRDDASVLGTYQSGSQPEGSEVAQRRAPGSGGWARALVTSLNQDRTGRASGGPAG